MLPCPMISIAMASLGILIGAAPAASQGVIPDKAGCPNCRIHASTDVVIKSDHFTQINGVYRDALGRIWVFGDDGMPAVFDSRGKFLATVGRKGEGPGEFRSPRSIILVPGDSVGVLEDNGRLTIYTPSLKFVRTLQAPLRQVFSSVVVRWPNVIVVSAMISTRDRAGFPLHIVDLSGPKPSIVKSFGSDGVMRPRESMAALLSSVTKTRSGGLLFSPARRYSIVEYGRDLREKAKFDRLPEWFREDSNLLPGGPSKPPSPVFLGASQDDTGMLWAFINRPSDQHSAAWKEFPRQGRDAPASTIAWHMLYDTRLEIIDPRTRQVIAVHDFDGEVKAVLAPGLVAFIDRDQDDVSSVRVVKLTLRR